MVIFSYTGSPQVKISQKVLGGGYFFDSHCTLMSKNYVAHSITVICVTG